MTRNFLLLLSKSRFQRKYEPSHSYLDFSKLENQDLVAVVMVIEILRSFNFSHRFEHVAQKMAEKGWGDFLNFTILTCYIKQENTTKLILLDFISIAYVTVSPMKT